MKKVRELHSYLHITLLGDMKTSTIFFFLQLVGSRVPKSRIKNYLL